MAKNKRLPEPVLAHLHGKGSLSEVLQIERAHLLHEAQTEMQRTISRDEPVAPTYIEVRVRRDGLSASSRVVGDDLSEFGRIVVHSDDTILSTAPWNHTEAPFIEVEGSLPFSGQRQIFDAIHRLTIGWGTFTCQVTLELLSRVSGIRNAKTLRKWIADLDGRKLIRYTPVHGDLRGSIIALTPPEHIRAAIERFWRTSRARA